MSDSGSTRRIRRRLASRLRGYSWAIGLGLASTGAMAATPAPMASVTGTVTSSKSFRAAQVYLRNLDKRLLYMVYTSAGQFRAVSLFPGNYEISVSAKGQDSAVQKLSVHAGVNDRIALSLREIPHSDAPITTTNSMAGQNSQVDVTLHPYEEIYPPGVGRDIIEQTCMVCHGENWLPSQPARAEVWQTRIDHMTGKDLWERPAQSYAEGLLSYRAQWLRFSIQDRKDLVEYLAKNFGATAKPRMVRTDQETPVDEARLSKAMYIEYYVPEDPPGRFTHDAQYQDAVGPFASLRTLQDVRFDAEGNVWATDRGAPSRLVKLDPRTGAWREWITPHPKSDIHELIIARDGMVWLPEHAEGPNVRNYLLGFNPKTEKWEYDIDMDPNDVIRNEIKWTDSISIDSKNNIYVNWIMGGALTKFDGTTKKVVGVYPLASSDAIPYGNVIDRNDNVFLALWGRGSIAKFDTHTNTWTEFSPPTFPGEVRRLNVDYQNNIWFGIYSAGSHRAGKMAMLNQKTGRISEISIPEQSAQPYDTSPDPQGNMWFPDTPQADRSAALGVYHPKDHSFTFYPKPQFDADTPKIQVTRAGAVWYAPRGSLKAPGIGVLYPDKDKIATLGAYYLNGPPGYPFK